MSSKFFILCLLLPCIRGACQDYGNGKYFCHINSEAEVAAACGEIKNADLTLSIVEVSVYNRSVSHLNLSNCLPQTVVQLDILANFIKELNLNHAKNSNLKKIRITSSSLRRLPPQLRSFESLEELTIERVNLTTSDFQAIPTTIRTLRINFTPIENILCNFLNSLTSLEKLYISGDKKLNSFDSSCLPKTLRYLALKSNDDLKELDLSPLKRFTGLTVQMYQNLVSCSCDFFEQYVEVLKLKSITIESFGAGHSYVSCMPSDKLSNYPWGINDATALIEFDALHANCLNGPKSQDEKVLSSGEVFETSTSEINTTSKISEETLTTSSTGNNQTSETPDQQSTFTKTSTIIIGFTCLILLLLFVDIALWKLKNRLETRVTENVAYSEEQL